jgi:hypothetical protein
MRARNRKLVQATSAFAALAVCLLAMPAEAWNYRYWQYTGISCNPNWTSSANPYVVDATFKFTGSTGNYAYCPIDTRFDTETDNDQTNPNSMTFYGVWVYVHTASVTDISASVCAKPWSGSTTVWCGSPANPQYSGDYWIPLYKPSTWTTDREGLFVKVQSPNASTTARLVDYEAVFAY